MRAGSSTNDHVAYETKQCIFSATFLRHFSVCKNAKPVSIKSRKAQAILAYLLINGSLNNSTCEHRDRICNLLWSEFEASKAHDSLRQAVSTLNKALSPVFQANRTELRLNISAFDVDIVSIYQQLEINQIHDLLLSSNSIYDSLLPDFDDLDPEYRIWLQIQRQTLTEKLTRQLESYLDEAEQPQNTKKRIAQALLNIDPSHEPACRALMQVYALAGDTAGALRTYKTLYDVLDEDYGEEPSATTQNLVAAIKLGEFEQQQDNNSPVKDVIDSIAEKFIAFPSENPVSKQAPARKLAIGIAPFMTDGVAEEKNYLVFGFRHELIACLVRFRDWLVVDLKSPSATHNTERSSLSQYTLQTTIYQHKDALILILTLQDSDAQSYVWSDRFELRLESWFEVQHTIVRRIAMALNVNLSAERLAQIASKPDVSLDIYDRWLRGQKLILSFKPQEHQRALAILRSIIAVAPNFTSAYLGFVQIENCRHMVNPGLWRSSPRLEEGLTLAKKALQLEPLNSRTHLYLGWSYALLGHYEHAAHSYINASNLNENDPWTLISSAQGLAFCDHKNRALEFADQSLTLDPNPSAVHWAYQVGIRFLCGDYMACVKAAELADNIIWNIPMWKTSALYHLKRIDDALQEAEFMMDYIHRNWAANSQPDNLTITRWLLQCCPVSRSDDWQCLQQGLKNLGLPVPSQPEYSCKAS